MSKYALVHHAYTPRRFQGLSGFWWQSADFSEEVRKIKDIAQAIRNAPMPAEIPVADALRIYDRTLEAASRFTDKGMEMQRDFSNLIASGPITLAVSSVLTDIGKYNQRVLFNTIKAAQSAGRKTVPSQIVKVETSKLLMNVAFGFEALEEIDESKNIVVRAIMNDPFMPFIVSKIVSVGRAAHAVVDGVFEPLKAAINAADKTMQVLITGFKWATLAGGLYLVYKLVTPDGKGK